MKLRDKKYMNIIKRKLRVCWTSNAKWAPSGYAQQTADIGRKFHESGWDASNFAYINMFGQSGGILTDAETGFRHYPIMDHMMGSDAMVNHARHFNADVVFSLLDVWTQNPQDLAQIGRYIPWTPVDYDPIPMQMTGILRYANRIIAMSRFGQKQLQDRGFASTYIPHHVDTKIFFPIDKKKRKEQLHMDPNMFVFGMVAANKDIFPRKSFQQVLEAYARFLQNHPNSLLYIHTNPDQPGGFPVRGYADYLGISNHVGYPERYKWNFDTSKEEMNNIYNSFDVYLAPSSSEGFCIPIIEAQATATPVITNNWTSMPELIIPGKSGFITNIGCKHFMPIGSYMAWPDTNDIYDKMELMFRSNRVEMGRAALQNVKDNYSLDKVWSQRWLPFLKKLQVEIYPQTLLTSSPPSA